MRTLFIVAAMLATCASLWAADHVADRVAVVLLPTSRPMPRLAQGIEPADGEAIPVGAVQVVYDLGSYCAGSRRITSVLEAGEWDGVVVETTWDELEGERCWYAQRAACSDTMWLYQYGGWGRATLRVECVPSGEVEEVSARWVTGGGRVR